MLPKSGVPAELPAGSLLLDLDAEWQAQSCAVAVLGDFGFALQPQSCATGLLAAGDLAGADNARGMATLEPL